MTSSTHIYKIDRSDQTDRYRKKEKKKTDRKKTKIHTIE